MLQIILFVSVQKPTSTSCRIGSTYAYEHMPFGLFGLLLGERAQHSFSGSSLNALEYNQSNQSNNLLLATDYASLCLTRYNMLTKCHAIELIHHPSSKNSKKFLFEVVERESFSFFSFFFFFFLEVHFQVCNDEQVTERKKKKVGPYCADRVPKS